MCNDNCEYLPFSSCTCFLSCLGKKTSLERLRSGMFSKADWDAGTKTKTCFSDPELWIRAKIYMEGLRQGPSVLVPYCGYNKSPKFIILRFWKSEVLKLRCWHNFVTSVGSRKNSFPCLSGFYEDPCDCIGSTWITVATDSAD